MASEICSDFILVHSPLLGPLSWRFVADHLRVGAGSVIVPDLTAAAAGGDVTRRFITAAAETIGKRGSMLSTVLVGHSGAGPLLPAIADATEHCKTLIYVDAGLPHPGKSWNDTAPPELVAQLKSLAGGDGVLPQWSEWFGPGMIDQLLPEPHTRVRFVRELPRLTLSYFDEPMPAAHWDGPMGYLQLSEIYASEADRAASAGCPVRRLHTGHLGPMTDPITVAENLATLLVDLHL